LSGWQIKKIPSEIGNLKKLEELYVLIINNYFFQYKILLYFLFFFLKKKKLKLHYFIYLLIFIRNIHSTRIKEIPSEIGNLSKLKRLYVKKKQNKT